MKKIISLLMIAAMIFTTLPVFADSEAPVVTLKYVTDGETYEAGSSVILGAETNVPVDVARVDFYANGIKIPGCITSLDKTLSWTIPTSGSYEIYASLTTTADGDPFVSNTVTVNGVAADGETVFEFDTVTDVTSITYGSWGENQYTENQTNSEYVKKSNHSAIWTLGPNATLVFKNLDVTRGDYQYLNYLIYSTNDVTLWSNLTNKADVTRPSSTNYKGGFIALRKGWNPVSILLWDAEEGASSTIVKDTYFASPSVIADIDKINFYSNYGVQIPEDSSEKTYNFPNAGQKLNEQTGLSDTTLYFDSAWLSTEPIAAPKAVSSIRTGATKVCNGLDKMTITFDKEMELSALSDGDVTVTDENGAAVDNFTLVPSTNALIVDFGENALSYDKTYTVTLSENIKDFYGKSVDSSTREFTFETIDSACTGVEPIASFTYPAANATVASDNVTLAAKVIFGGSVSKVEFYEGDTKLADGIKGADGEWYAANCSLSAGAHSVNAVVTYGDALTKKTAVTGFNVSETVNYSLTGIFDGIQIPLNATYEPLVSTNVAITPTTGVSKVVYKIDGVPAATVTSSPFSWEMPITAVNKDVTVSADVYSIGVNSVASINYKAVYVSVLGKRDNITDNFDSHTDGEKITATSFGIFQQNSERNAFSTHYKSVEALGRKGMAAMIDRDESITPTAAALLGATGPKNTWGSAIGSGTVNPIVKFSFDLYLPNAGEGKIVVRNNDNVTISNIVACDLSQLPVGEWIKSEVYIDTAAKAIFSSFNDKSYIYNLSEAELAIINDVPSGETWAKVFLAFCPLTDLYIDNFVTERVGADTTRNDFFVNGIKKDVTASGETVNVSVANLTAADSNVSVIIALYTEDNEMIAIYPFEDVDVKSKEFKQITQNVPYSVDGKTGTKVKAFVLNNMNDITPVKTIR